MLNTWKETRKETETPTQLMCRYGTTAVLTVLETNIFPYFSCQDVVEITGAQSTGKSELLHHFLARCILPFQFQSHEIGGLDTPVFFISNESMFDAERLVNIIVERLDFLHTSEGLSKAELRDFAISRLKHQFCFHCTSSQEFVSALKVLCCHIAETEKRYMIMVDDIAAFHLSDKKRIKKQAAFMSHLQEVSKSFEELSRKYRCPIIVTRRRLYKNRSVDRMAHGMSWRLLVTWELELSKKYVNDEGTFVVLSNLERKTKKLCCIKDNGFNFLTDING
ncbi:DNA repair protein XRCC2-like [Uloborus diversus]|uniref:DNA repair protein XRCC2-like n=1 Tax=Uloborus diversus TaxID=327109 RepID=UPI002409FFF8|nr:DNA repair protein XRCC2-like [Uloborus diversus]